MPKSSFNVYSVHCARCVVCCVLYVVVDAHFCVMLVGRRMWFAAWSNASSFCRSFFYFSFSISLSFARFLSDFHIFEWFCIAFVQSIARSHLYSFAHYFVCSPVLFHWRMHHFWLYFRITRNSYTKTSFLFLHLRISNTINWIHFASQKLHKIQQKAHPKFTRVFVCGFS